MHIFTIDSDNNITRHATKKAAHETGAAVFNSAESLAKLVGSDRKRLAAIWNSLTGVRPVKKFTSSAVGARRLFAEVQKLTVSAAEAPESVSTIGKARSRKQILLGLISRKDGASLEELISALGWQKHSVRGFIATLGRTMKIESFRTEQGVRTYRTS